MSKGCRGAKPISRIASGCNTSTLWDCCEDLSGLRKLFAVRSILRHRDTLLKSASRQVLLMQKALTQMNLQLHNVITDITGLSGLAIIDAILSGKREPSKLSALCDSRIKASRQLVAKSLVGDYRPEHLFCLQQALESYRHFQSQIASCDEHIEQMLARFDIAAR